jgi:hypothetical protein
MSASTFTQRSRRTTEVISAMVYCPVHSAIFVHQQRLFLSNSSFVIRCRLSLSGPLGARYCGPTVVRRFDP